MRMGRRREGLYERKKMRGKIDWEKEKEELEERVGRERRVEEYSIRYNNIIMYVYIIYNIICIIVYNIII